MKATEGSWCILVIVRRPLQADIGGKPTPVLEPTKETGGE